MLSEEEYKSWLRKQEEAETALDDREKKLFNVACEIETDLELLGEGHVATVITPYNPPSTQDA